MKRTVSTFREAKCTGNKLAMITAYDYTSARLVDSGNIDAILVGDSLGMVCLGYKDTLSVTMEDMIHHTRAVSRGVKNALIIGDMPFMSYQASVYDAVKNAGRLVQEAGAEAIKLEGGTVVLQQVEAIVNAQIPVMGHIGLTPQSSNIFGGFKVQGKDANAARQIIEDAKKLEDAGAFCIVLECIPNEIAKLVTEAVSIPTIGIGAGPYCDGQVLVFQDLLGMNLNFKPKFVKVFENVGELIKSGVNKYADEVHKGTFPSEQYCFKINASELEKLR